MQSVSKIVMCYELPVLILNKGTAEVEVTTATDLESTLAPTTWASAPSSLEWREQQSHGVKIELKTRVA